MHWIWFRFFIKAVSKKFTFQHWKGFRSRLLCYTRLFSFPQIISKHKNSFGSARLCDRSILVYPLGFKTITLQVHLKIPHFILAWQWFCRGVAEYASIHFTLYAIKPQSCQIHFLSNLCVSLSPLRWLKYSDTLSPKSGIGFQRDQRHLLFSPLPPFIPP